MTENQLNNLLKYFILFYQVWTESTHSQIDGEFQPIKDSFLKVNIDYFSDKYRKMLGADFLENKNVELLIGSMYDYWVYEPKAAKPEIVIDFYKQHINLNTVLKEKTIGYLHQKLEQFYKDYKKAHQRYFKINRILQTKS